MKIPNIFRVLTWKLGKYLKNKHKEKIATDPAFQANSGYTDKDGKDGRWDKQNKISYVTNLILGQAPSFFIFADMELCLKNAKKKNNIKDIKYFTKWLKKGKYMNLDSYNRNQCIGGGNIEEEKSLEGFFNDEVPIKNDTYYVCDKPVTIDDTNNVWSKLKLIPAMKKHILENIKINIICYEDCSTHDLSYICRAVNEGVPFTPPLYRNTFVTGVARKVREFAMKKENVEFFSFDKWWSPANRVKREVDATIARMLWQTFNAFDKQAVNDGKLLDMYTRDISTDTLNKGMSLIKEFVNFLKKSEDAMGQGKSLWYGIPTKVVVFHHLFDYFLEIKKKNLWIDDTRYDELFRDFVKIYTKELDSSQTYPGIKGKFVSFKTIKNGMQLYNVQLFKEIYENNNFNLEDYCINKDKRAYNSDEKLIMAVRDDWKTPEGKDIPPSELHDPDKFEGGHKKPFSKHFDTSLNNGAVQTKKDNRDLSNNDIST